MTDRTREDDDWTVTIEGTALCRVAAIPECVGWSGIRGLTAERSCLVDRSAGAHRYGPGRVSLWLSLWCGWSCWAVLLIPVLCCCSPRGFPCVVPLAFSPISARSLNVQCTQMTNPETIIQTFLVHGHPTWDYFMNSAKWLIEFILCGLEQSDT